MRICHLTTKDEWNHAQRLGRVEAASLSSDGFIHCSRFDQMESVANRFYRGLGDLVLLVIDTRLLDVEWRWEAACPPDGSQAALDEGRFPHVYGAFPVGAVINAIDWVPDLEGSFTLPMALS